MKNTILILAAITISFSTVLANKISENLDPTETILVNSYDANTFSKSNFNSTTDNSDLDSISNLSAMKILNENGEVELRQPVIFEDIVTNKKMLKLMTYKLGQELIN